MSEQTEQVLISPTLNIGGVTPNLLVTPWAFAEAVTIPFALPSSGNSLAITVASSARYLVGMYLNLGDYGQVRVVGLPSSTTIQIETASGTAGQVIPTYTPIEPCSKPISVAAASGIYDALATGFTVPAAGATVTVTLTTGGWAETGMFIFIVRAGYFLVTDVVSDTQLLLSNVACDETNAVYNAVAGTEIATGAPCWPDYPTPFTFDSDHFSHSTAGELGSRTVSLATDPTKFVQHLSGTTKQRFTSGTTTTHLLSSTTTADNAEYTIWSVTFTGGPFASAPAVQLTPEIVDRGTSYSYYWVYWIGTMRVKNLTSSGFDIVVSPGANTNKPSVAPSWKVHWLAIGTVS